MQLPPRPILTWKQIEAAAVAFCEQHAVAQRSFPLDLEELASFDLSIDIRIVDGLIEDCGSPAQIALEDGCPVITVDAAQYHANTGYYRYSLAHEIAHWLLHREWLTGVYKLIHSVSDWKDVLRSISEEDYRWIESQAEECAAYLVAPPAVFDPFLQDQIDLVRPYATSLGPQEILPYLANPVCQKFGITAAAAQARIRKSSVWRQFAENEGSTGL